MPRHILEILWALADLGGGHRDAHTHSGSRIFFIFTAVHTGKTLVKQYVTHTCTHTWVGAPPSGKLKDHAHCMHTHTSITTADSAADSNNVTTQWSHTHAHTHKDYLNTHAHCAAHAHTHTHTETHTHKHTHTRTHTHTHLFPVSTMPVTYYNLPYVCAETTMACTSYSLFIPFFIKSID